MQDWRAHGPSPGAPEAGQCLLSAQQKAVSLRASSGGGEVRPRQRAGLGSGQGSLWSLLQSVDKPGSLRSILEAPWGWGRHGRSQRARDHPWEGLEGGGQHGDPPGGHLPWKPAESPFF